MMNNQRVWREVKRTQLILVITGLILGGLAACSTAPTGAGNTSARTPTQATPPPTAISSPATLMNLEDEASQWGIFYDGKGASAKLDNVASPSVDGTALKIALVSGQPYTGIHVYRNLAPIPTARTFKMTLSFYFHDASSIQALEFTMNTWVNNLRWEWALQWEHIGDGTAQQGNPPTWRLWTGRNWQNFGVRQQLSANSWHTLHLSGDITNRQVYYISFSCDSTAVPLRQTFAPVSSPEPNKLAVAVQLDGNSHEDAYDMYIDQVNLLWSS